MKFKRTQTENSIKLGKTIDNETDVLKRID
jgi:hypothetical protein